MRKYSASLDLILAAMKKLEEGKTATCAKYLSQAMQTRDFPSTLASLEADQTAAYASMKSEDLEEKKATVIASRTQSLAKFLADKATKKETAKARRKVVKADAMDDEFEETLDDMTIAGEDDDLTLDDLVIDDEELSSDIAEDIDDLSLDDEMVDLDGEGLEESASDDEDDSDADEDDDEGEEKANIKNFKGKQAAPFKKGGVKAKTKKAVKAESDDEEDDESSDDDEEDDDKAEESKSKSKAKAKKKVKASDDSDDDKSDEEDDDEDKKEESSAKSRVSRVLANVQALDRLAKAHA